MQVSIDSGPLLPVAYGSVRPDIAAAFPGYTDAGGARGAYLLDTTTFSNGIHQIGWFVTDSCGRADGIGSRFFTVQNGSSLRSDDNDQREEPGNALRSLRSLRLAREGTVRTLNGAPADVSPNSAGVHVVSVAQGERIEVLLPSIDGAAYTGVQIVNGEARALPLGSSLDAEKGIFYWQPAAGFLGSFELVFAPTEAPGRPEGPHYDRDANDRDASDRDASATGVVRTFRSAEPAAPVHVRVVVGPPLRMAIDAPISGATVRQPFIVAGWAIDLAAREGSGIDTVHAWAYPTAGGAPIFLGVAAIGDSRPDVSATYGPQFDRSAYSLMANGLQPGTYDVVVYAERAATGSFDGAQIVCVTIR